MQSTVHINVSAIDYDATSRALAESCTSSPVIARFFLQLYVIFKMRLQKNYILSRYCLPFKVITCDTVNACLDLVLHHLA